MTSQKVMTSAIEGLAVADVRKALQQVRDSWKNHTPDTPICLSDILSNGMTIEQFSFRHVMGHHVKRHHKSASGKKKDKRGGQTHAGSSQERSSGSRASSSAQST
jgi:hypothetical protein